MVDLKRVKYKDKEDKNHALFPKGMCNKDPNGYGERVNKIFPLLDPDIQSHEERVLKH
jgi:hypothetical protein